MSSLRMQRVFGVHQLSEHRHERARVYYSPWRWYTRLMLFPSEPVSWYMARSVTAPSTSGVLRPPMGWLE